MVAHRRPSVHFLDVDPDSGIVAGRRWEDELYGALRSVTLSCSSRPRRPWSPVVFRRDRARAASGKHVFPLRVDAALGWNWCAICRRSSWVTVTRCRSARRRSPACGSRSVGLLRLDRTRSPYPACPPSSRRTRRCSSVARRRPPACSDSLQPTLVRGTARLGGHRRPVGQRQVVAPPSRRPAAVGPPSGPLDRHPPVHSRGRARYAAWRRLSAGRSRLVVSARTPRKSSARSVTRRRAWTPSEPTSPTARGRRRPANVLVSIDQAEELVTRAGPREQATLLGLLPDRWATTARSGWCPRCGRST